MGICYRSLQNLFAFFDSTVAVSVVPRVARVSVSFRSLYTQLHCGCIQFVFYSLSVKGEKRTKKKRMAKKKHIKQPEKQTTLVLYIVNLLTACKWWSREWFASVWKCEWNKKNKKKLRQRRRRSGRKNLTNTRKIKMIIMFARLQAKHTTATVAVATKTEEAKKRKKKWTVHTRGVHIIRFSHRQRT